MSEKRYYIKKVIREERPKLFSSVGADYKYFIVERVKRSWGEYGGNLLFNFGVDYAFAEKVCNLLNEQQDTIRKLQDLCGKSDYENAQLRQKVKELQDKIDWLCEKYDYPNEKDKTKVVKNDKQN